MMQRVFHAEHATPRMTVQHELLEPESLADLLDFLAVAIDRPQGQILRRV